MTWLLSAALPLWGAGPESAQAPAPTAKKVPHMQKLHGDELVDPYYWMRERENPEVRAYLEKENAYADAFMKPTEALQKTLYDEMLGRIKETDLTVPYRDRGTSTSRAPRRESSIRSTAARRAPSRPPSRSSWTSTSSRRASAS